MPKPGETHKSLLNNKLLLFLVDDEAENSCLKTGNIIAPAVFLDIN
jgi:hypothetical protein